MPQKIKLPLFKRENLSGNSCNTQIHSGNVVKLLVAGVFVFIQGCTFWRRIWSRGQTQGLQRDGASASGECLIIFNLKFRPKLKSSSTKVCSDWGPIWIRVFEFIFLNPSWLWVSLHSDWLQFSEPMKSSVLNLLFRLFVKYCQSSRTVFHMLCFFIPGGGVFTWPPRDLKPPLFNTWALSEEFRSLPLLHRKLGFPVYKQHRDL